MKQEETLPRFQNAVAVSHITASPNETDALGHVIIDSDGKMVRIKTLGLNEEGYVDYKGKELYPLLESSWQRKDKISSFLPFRLPTTNEANNFLNDVVVFGSKGGCVGCLDIRERLEGNAPCQVNYLRRGAVVSIVKITGRIFAAATIDNSVSICRLTFHDEVSVQLVLFKNNNISIDLT